LHCIGWNNNILIIRNARYNSENLQTVFLYVLRIQDTIVIIILRNIRRFVFVMEIQCLQCAEEIEILSYSVYFL